MSQIFVMSGREPVNIDFGPPVGLFVVNSEAPEEYAGGVASGALLGTKMCISDRHVTFPHDYSPVPDNASVAWASNWWTVNTGGYIMDSIVDQGSIDYPYLLAAGPASTGQRRMLVFYLPFGTHVGRKTVTIMRPRTGSEQGLFRIGETGGSNVFFYLGQGLDTSVSLADGWVSFGSMTFYRWNESTQMDEQVSAPYVMSPGGVRIYHLPIGHSVSFDVPEQYCGPLPPN